MIFASRQHSVAKPQARLGGARLRRALEFSVCLKSGLDGVSLHRIEIAAAHEDSEVWQRRELGLWFRSAAFPPLQPKLGMDCRRVSTCTTRREVERHERRAPTESTRCVKISRPCRAPGKGTKRSVAFRLQESGVGNGARHPASLPGVHTFLQPEGCAPVQCGTMPQDPFPEPGFTATETTNIQHRTPNFQSLARLYCWTLDVRCSALDVWPGRSRAVLSHVQFPFTHQTHSHETPINPQP